MRVSQGLCPRNRYRRPMDDAARVLAATRGEIDDVVPSSLRELLDARLRNAAMTPGVLTQCSARTTGREYDAGELDQHAAGVQLIYEGLHFTRTLSRSPPWEDERGATREDLHVLAANVLVARGLAALAHTEAARTAIETVRAFGRHEITRAVGCPESGPEDHALEADVFELAIVTGTAAVGAPPPTEAGAFATELARSFERELPAASELLSEPVVEELAGLVAGCARRPAGPEDTWADGEGRDP